MTKFIHHPLPVLQDSPSPWPSSLLWSRGPHWQCSWGCGSQCCVLDHSHILWWEQPSVWTSHWLHHEQEQREVASELWWIQRSACSLCELKQELLIRVFHGTFNLAEWSLRSLLGYLRMRCSDKACWEAVSDHSWRWSQLGQTEYAWPEFPPHSIQQLWE